MEKYGVESEEKEVVPAGEKRAGSLCPHPLNKRVREVGAEFCEACQKYLTGV